MRILLCVSALCALTGCARTTAYNRGYVDGRREAFIDVLEHTIEADARHATREETRAGIWRLHDETRDE